MNLETSIDRPLKAAHRDATDDANRWRGHCIDCFARIEKAVAETLRTLSKSERHGASVKEPSLFGRRIEALRLAISPGGPFQAEGRDVGKALAKLAPWLEQRNNIVHGVGTVWISGSGDWLWRYCYIGNTKNNRSEMGMIDRNLAEEMEAELSGGAQSLCAHLRNFAGKLA
jgi:hypothetical protein